MKLYVWDPALTDYTDGIMFAIAENPQQAREALQSLLCGKWIPPEDLAEEPVEYDLDTPRAWAVWGGG